MFIKSGCNLQILKTAATSGLHKIASAIPEVQSTIDKVVAKKDSDNFVYFWTRAVSADRENLNADIFPLDELKIAYPTFIGRGLYLDHNANSVANAVGKVFDAKLLEDPTAEDELDRYYVGCLCGVDKTTHPDIASKVVHGVIDSVSMGASVAQAECSICHKVCSTPEDFCIHLQNQGQIDPETGKKCCSINRGVSFTELSLVGVPADPMAKMQQVFSGFVSNIKKQADTTNTKFLEKFSFNIPCGNEHLCEMIYNLLKSYEKQGIVDLSADGSILKLSVKAKNEAEALTKLENISKEQGLDVEKPLKQEENLMSNEEIKPVTSETEVEIEAKKKQKWSDKIKPETLEKITKEGYTVKEGTPEYEECLNAGMSFTPDMYENGKLIVNELISEKKADLHTLLSTKTASLNKEAIKIVDNISISDFEPWSGAVSMRDEIINADKADDFDFLMEDIYPEGITYTQLNDILWFEQEWLRESLGMTEENEDGEESLETETAKEPEMEKKSEVNMEKESAEEETKMNRKAIEPEMEGNNSGEPIKKEESIVSELTDHQTDEIIKTLEEELHKLEDESKDIKKEESLEATESAKEVEAKPELPVEPKKEDVKVEEPKEVKPEVKEEPVKEEKPVEPKKEESKLSKQDIDEIIKTLKEVLKNEKEEAGKGEDESKDIEGIEKVLDILGGEKEPKKEEKKEEKPENKETKEEPKKEETKEENKEETKEEVKPVFANVTRVSLLKTANILDSKWVFHLKDTNKVACLSIKNLLPGVEEKVAYLTSQDFYNEMAETLSKHQSLDSEAVKQITANFNEKIKVGNDEAKSQISKATNKVKVETDGKAVANTGTATTTTLTDDGKAQKQDKVNSKEDAGAIEHASKKAPVETDIKVSAELDSKLKEVTAALESKEAELQMIKLQQALEAKTAKARNIVTMSIKAGLVQCNEQFRQEELLKQSSPVKAKEEAMKRTADSMVKDLLALSDEELDRQASYLSNFKVEAEVKQLKPIKIEASIEESREENIIKALSDAMM